MSQITWFTLIPIPKKKLKKDESSVGPFAKSVFGDTFKIVFDNGLYWINRVKPGNPNLLYLVGKFSAVKGQPVTVAADKRKKTPEIYLGKIHQIIKFIPFGVISAAAIIQHFSLNTMDEFMRKIPAVTKAFEEIYTSYPFPLGPKDSMDKDVQIKWYIDSIIQDAKFYFDSINKIGINCEMCELGAKYKCGGCKRVFYCSADCQKRHWGNLHYKNCA